MSLTAVGQGTEHPILVRAHVDFDSHAIFPSVLLPALPEEELAAIIVPLLENPRTVVEIRDATDVTLPRGYSALAGTKFRVERIDPFVRLIQEAPDRLVINDRDLVFTRRIYCYSPRELSVEMQDRLRSLARENGLTLSFRGPAYAALVDSQLKPKAFISHDWRDKDEIARPIPAGRRGAQGARGHARLARRCSRERPYCCCWHTRCGGS